MSLCGGGGVKQLRNKVNRRKKGGKGMKGKITGVRVLNDENYKFVSLFMNIYHEKKSI